MVFFLLFCQETKKQLLKVPKTSTIKKLSFIKQLQTKLALELHSQNNPIRIPIRRENKFNLKIQYHFNQL